MRRRNGRVASCRRSATSRARSAAWSTRMVSVRAHSCSHNASMSPRATVHTWAGHWGETSRPRVRPPLCDHKGIAGVHLCLAEESISKVETAEKKARADTTQVPTWIILIEGNSSADVGAAGAALSRELQPLLGADRAQILTSVYQLEFSRCKTPWSAG